MKNNLKILTSYWFMTGLILLLLNDFIFKEMYGNWLTGKLSDFTGLFIFPLFWTALFPKNKNKIFLFTALFFIFWKSPYSERFIDYWNMLIFFKITRVVDYSDCIALFILPIAFQYECKNNTNKHLKLNPAYPLILSAFSFMATSLPNHVVEVEKEYTFEFSKDTLSRRIYNLPFIDNYFRDNYRMDSTGLFYVDLNGSDTIVSENELVNRFVQDTMILPVKEDFCIGGYDARITLSGDDQISNIKLLEFYHRCRKNEADKSSLTGKDVTEKLTNSFENKVIEELKKN